MLPARRSTGGCAPAGRSAGGSPCSGRRSSRRSPTSTQATSRRTSPPAPSSGTCCSGSSSPPTSWRCSSRTCRPSSGSRRAQPAGDVPRALPAAGHLRPLGVQAEVVAMATDLAEIIGGALALKLLFDVPLLTGGLITGAVAFALLALQGKGHRPFELAILGLLAVIAAAAGRARLRPGAAGVRSRLLGCRHLRRAGRAAGLPAPAHPARRAARIDHGAGARRAGDRRRSRRRSC